MPGIIVWVDQTMGVEQIQVTAAKTMCRNAVETRITDSTVVVAGITGSLRVDTKNAKPTKDASYVLIHIL